MTLTATQQPVGWAPAPGHVVRSPEEIEHEEFRRVHSRLPDGWMPATEMEDKIGPLIHAHDSQLPAAATGYAASMALNGWLQQRGYGAEYRRAEKPPEFLTPAQKAELETERSVKADKERAAERAKVGEDETRKKRENEDRELLGNLERVLGPRFGALETQISELREALGR